MLVRVKLFSLVFVRTHRLVSEGERERAREWETENAERTRRNEGEGEQPRMEERRELEERKREGWRGGEER